MLKDFNEWYIDVNIAPTGEIIENRKKAIKDYVAKITPDDICNLVQIYYGFSVEKEFLDDFADKFIEFDAGFSKRNREELILLAGATLAYIAETIVGQDSLVELLVLINRKYHTPASTTQIEETIVKQFKKDSLNSREKLFELDYEAYHNSLSVFKERIEEDADDNVTSELIDAIIKRDKEIQNSLINSIKILKEDSQILWWLNSEWSTTYSEPWKKIDKARACLVLGKEVAEFVYKYPGPYTIEGVLYKALEKCKGQKAKKGLVEIIQNMDDGEKRKCIESLNKISYENLLPLHAAIKCENGTTAAEQWVPKFNNDVLLNQNLKEMHYEEYALYMYFEEMAIKCYMDL